jgi:hypothetical protein
LQIQFEEFSEQFCVPDIPFHRLQAVFVQGQPNVKYFGVESADDFPENIMVTDEGILFNKLGKLSPVGVGQDEEKGGDAVWKLFLNKVPSEAQVSDVIDCKTKV